MSHSPEAHSEQSEVIVVEVSPTNGAGLWGFVFSLFGVICCIGSCFSVVGLILSLIGLSKKPRGFAIAGVVLGVVGMTGGLVFWSTAGAPIIKVARTLGFMEIRTIASMWEAEKLVIESYEQTGTLPQTLGELTGNTVIFIDQWGTDLAYRVSDNGEGYSLHSAGRDTLWGTGDEISYTVLDADDDYDFILSQGTVSLIDATPLPYTDEQLENAPVDSDSSATPAEPETDEGG